MSFSCKEIVGYLDSLFTECACPDDYSRNGLQVQCGDELSTVAFAVDATSETFSKAAELNAGLLVCHHGIFWGNGLRSITGIDAERIRILMKNDISLYAVHLPLDAHRTIGNNAGLADIIGLEAEAREPFGFVRGVYAGCIGNLCQRIAVGRLASILGNALNTECRIYGCEPERLVQRVAIVSGAGEDEIPDAARMGADLLITGELGHVGGIQAREYGIGVLHAGHYATETVGPKALMAAVSAHFNGLECRWIDADTKL